jgi:hypothetical protein
MYTSTVTCEKLETHAFNKRSLHVIFRMTAHVNCQLTLNFAAIFLTIHATQGLFVIIHRNVTLVAIPTPAVNHPPPSLTSELI